ncbi:SUKH-4 family immunity protein [Actinoplanes sp. NPDC023714]|uniref:SUKH-4 family immunity protein n=1 Tax=Actinoplanes sp. NPDC023714 TaxID=3154322 RepID=UPI0033E778DD
MPTDALPQPPEFDAVETWAGAGRVIRAGEPELASWELPEQQKSALVTSGVPIIDGLVDVVSFQVKPTMYQLAQAGGQDRVFGAAAVTGAVVEHSTEAGMRFVNSSIVHWLWSLHLVGSWVTGSVALARWDESPEAEEQTFAEIAALLERIRELDPPAVGDGSHDDHFWPAVLDRWLY